jgi:hypothetical protein
MRRTLAAVFAVLSLTLVMGACSSDSQKVADLVKAQVKKDTNVDAKVSCPSSLEAKKGNKGSCIATGDFTAFLSTLGYDLTGKTATEVKYDIEFVSDTTITMTPDNADLQSKFGGGATAPSSTDSSSSAPGSTDSTSSLDSTLPLETDSSSS